MADLQQDFLEKLKISSNGTANKINRADQAFHAWYRFVLSYPPHLVKRYINEFGLSSDQTILDPFSGTGTTLVEAKLNRVRSVGVEANPFAHFAGTVKASWNQDADEMLRASHEIARATQRLSTNKPLIGKENAGNRKAGGNSLQTLDEKKSALLIKNSISPLPLHKTLILKSQIDLFKGKPFYKHLLLALAKSTVFSASNLKFGPEVGVGKIKQDAPVVSSWVREVENMVEDIADISGKSYPNSENILGDSREIEQMVLPYSVDAVITSPPYPNEKDYSRTTRLESVLLGLMGTKKELRAQKKTFIRSNTRGVYKDDNDYEWIRDLTEITGLAKKIEERRIELGKTSGFEKQYAKVTLEYFGGMARHLTELRNVLRPSAKLAYVVGDQASYFGILIRTGKLLSQVAESLGYKIERIDLFRTRFATATQEELREEVVIFRWDGV